ncbi:hypothetical protein [Oceanispirochaeta sp.]|uniref:hypothetical protein n=1 Tax=Oceanispirochaeta sp. TaxID=2035350 RepID=UPI00262F8A6A|nr:hypothetical protein [Oceanispirochaeta sp.]MDA3957414.1 hypothetical protein [Oceanispirochaeta sp.]
MKIDENRKAWNGLMRDLPESVFMEVMNNYLGGVATPYNKTDLLNTLAARLGRPENEKKQISMIRREDILILSAIQWFSCPDVFFLKEFFSARITPFEVQSRITSLEERLLVFSSLGANGICLCCSPLLPESIHNQLSPQQLYDLHPSLPPETGTLPLLNGSFLICFLSLIHREKQIGNNDGSLKKKFLQRLSQLYPVDFFSAGESEELHLILNTLKSLKLLSIQGGNWSLKIENLKQFSSLDRRNQLLTLWGQLISADRGSPEKGRILTESLISHLPANRGIEKEDLVGLISILGDPIFQGPLPLPVNALIKRFEIFHILVRKGECYYLHPMVPRLIVNPSPAPIGTVFFHATFDVNLTPETPFSLLLTLSLTPERYDAFAQLKMTDQSFASFLKAGLNLNNLEEELEGRFSLQLTQNVHFSMKDWEKEYNSCRLWDGLVLEMDETHSQVLEQSGLLKPFILKILAPGVFLMGRENRNEWEEVLEQLGIRTVPHVRGKQKAPPVVPDFFIPAETGVIEFNPYLSEEPSPASEEVPRHMEGLYKKLRSMTDISAEDKPELEDRIRRGVIFMEEQLDKGMIKGGIRKVKGLDYQGKLRMIQSVMGNRAWMLEVNLPEGDFDIITHRVIPLKLENHKESEAQLIGTELPDKPFQCPVRKISQISKVRLSLF